MTDRWWAVEAADGVHVVPLVDLVGHELSEDCACGPQPEEVVPGSWMFSHSSLDGRELKEVA